MSQADYRIHGRVFGALTHQPLAGHRVEAWDKDLIFNDLVGSCITASDGSFRIEFSRSYFSEIFLDRRPDLFFKVFDGQTLIHSTQNKILWNLDAGDRTVDIAVSWPQQPGRGASAVSIDELARLVTAESGSGDLLGTRLRDAGIAEVFDLFGGRGGEVLNALEPDTETRARFSTLARFAAVSGDLSLSGKLFDAGFRSLTAIAKTPLPALQESLGKLTESELAALGEIHSRTQTIRSGVVSFAIGYNRSQSADGAWYIRDAAPIRRLVCTECACCDNIFSARAYLLDLVGFVYDHWAVPPPTLEQIFLQDIDDLKCDEAMRPVSQAQLAAEVLEKFLGQASLPLAAGAWSDAFASVYGDLLDMAHVKVEELPASVDADRQAVTPTCAVVDRVVQAIRDLYFDKKGDALTENGKSEFENKIAALFGPAFALYRSTLIGVIGQTATGLNAKLFIDLTASGSRITNRRTQAIESVQSLLLSIRTGDIVDLTRNDIPAGSGFTPADCSGDEVTDQEWYWLSNYPTWSSLMFVMMYPECVLPPPTSRGWMSPGFAEAINAAAARPDSRTLSDALDAFSDYVQRIGQMNLLELSRSDGNSYLLGAVGNELWINVYLQAGGKWGWAGWYKASGWDADYQPVRAGITQGSKILANGQDQNGTRKSFLLTLGGTECRSTDDTEIGTYFNVETDGQFRVTIRSGDEVVTKEIWFRENTDSEPIARLRKCLAAPVDPFHRAATLDQETIILVCQSTNGTVFWAGFLPAPRII